MKTGNENWRVGQARLTIVTMVRPTALIAMSFLAGSVCSAGTPRLYPPAKEQAGGLRMAQVIGLATQAEIDSLGKTKEILLASGLKETDLKAGSLAMGRVYCCHPPTDSGTALWFYVPPDMPVNVGDLVVLRMGRVGTKMDPGAINTVTEVREKQGIADSKCSWEPRNETLWHRLLYCSWMPAEGWVHTKGFYDTWLKPASGAKP